MNMSQNKNSCSEHKKGTAPTTKFRMSQLAGKLMTTVFCDSWIILLIDYKDQDVSVRSILEWLKEAI